LTHTGPVDHNRAVVTRAEIEKRREDLARARAALDGPAKGRNAAIEAYDAALEARLTAIEDHLVPPSQAKAGER